jgi:hypothetical protein
MEPLQKAIAAGYFNNATRAVEYHGTSFIDPGHARFQLVRKTGTGAFFDTLVRRLTSFVMERVILF